MARLGQDWAKAKGRSDEWRGHVVLCSKLQAERFASLVFNSHLLIPFPHKEPIFWGNQTLKH
jgi:hypothetical protein